MTEYESFINGLPVPPLLVTAIRDGKWKAPRDPDLIQRIFGENNPDYSQFYDLETMERQNRRLPSRQVREVYGEIIDGISLGLDPQRAVLIGDLGSDMPIALDYRESVNDPRVLYLARAGWIEVAQNIESLLRRLGQGCQED